MKPLNRSATISDDEQYLSITRSYPLQKDARVRERNWTAHILGVGTVHFENEDITPASRARLDRLLAWDGWQVHEDRTRTGVDDERVVVEYVWEGE